MRRALLTIAASGLAVLLSLALALAGLGWAAARVAVLHDSDRAAAWRAMARVASPGPDQTRSSAGRGASSAAARSCLQSVSRGTTASAGRSA